MCVYIVCIYIFCNERKNGLSRIQRCKSRMQFFSFEILFSRKLSLNVFSQKLGMQNTHPDEFFKFDFPGHEISSENNFIRTFFAYFSHGGIETSFSVPLAANIFFSSSLIQSIRYFYIEHVPSFSRIRGKFLQENLLVLHRFSPRSGFWLANSTLCPNLAQSIFCWMRSFNHYHLAILNYYYVKQLTYF